MNPNKKKSLIVILALLSLCTIIVYALPSISGLKFFDSPFTWLLSHEEDAFSQHALIHFIQWQQQQITKEISISTELNWMISWPLLWYEDGNVLSWTLLFGSKHQLKPDGMQESAHFQIDWNTAVFSWTQKLYNALYNAHADSVVIDERSYIKLNEQDLIQELTTSPKILLRQSLLNHYKDTRIELDDTSLSLKNIYDWSVNSVRILEVSKEETYVEVEWPALQFSGSFLENPRSFSWSFAFSWSQINGTLQSKRNMKNTYKLQMEHSNEYNASFDGTVIIWEERIPSLTIEWVITRPAWITLSVKSKVTSEKIWSIRWKSAPKESIKRGSIKSNLLGL